ncbi:hypothetical protein IQ249_24735 [Lusitaniella coriacea LEGE 07157]|uniref:Uncharacterized protein n=1 Tax=Lusitaniella coriacea LEGE 07157 TaxID=945747 RepID=A0A8J7E3E9_9CYAN|nr:hypothetical protein [Lusitaniella coriacea]MBE9119067.1 hypothetical protein [Lusitaniella coriacea LEGE 07157]
MPLSNPWHFLGAVPLGDGEWRFFPNPSLNGEYLTFEADSQGSLSYEEDYVRTKILVRRVWNVSNDRLFEKSQAIYFSRGETSKVVKLPSLLSLDLGLRASLIQVRAIYSYPSKVESIWTDVQKLNALLVRGYEG